MKKNNGYIYWDSDSVPESERKIYIQCEKCFTENKKGFKWPGTLWQGNKNVKCNICNTIIYKKLRKKFKNNVPPEERKL